MAKTKKTRPWDVTIRDPKLTVECHDHRHGFCDLDNFLNKNHFLSDWNYFRIKKAEHVARGECLKNIPIETKTFTCYHNIFGKSVTQNYCNFKPENIEEVEEYRNEGLLTVGGYTSVVHHMRSPYSHEVTKHKYDNKAKCICDEWYQHCSYEYLYYWAEIKQPHPRAHYRWSDPKDSERTKTRCETHNAKFIDWREELNPED